MKKHLRLFTHSVVVQLIIGALLKAYLPQASIIEQSLTWTTFATIGLFMSVGLQLHPEKFKNDFVISSLIVALTTIIPITCFFGISRAFEISSLGAWTVAAILVTTGTGVTIQTLNDLGMIRSKPGEFIILISALDDIPAAIIMAVLLAMAPIIKADALMLNWKFVALAVGFYIVLFVLRKKEFAYKKLITCLLLFAFGIFSAKVMEAFHVSTVMGGLLSGILISLTLSSIDDESSELMDKLLKPVLILYMVFIGMKLSPSIFKAPWAIALSVILIVVAIVTKWGTTYLLLKNRKELHPEIVSWGMVPRGIPGFAFASASVAAGLISSELFTILILVVSVTTWIGLIGIEISARKKNLVKF